MPDDQLKQRTARGLLWGGIGSGTFQLLGLLFGVFLARLLTPADYGLVTSLLIFPSVAGLFAESGFILAIVNKPAVSDDDYNAVFWFNLSVSLILYIILFFCAPLIAHFYRQPEILSLSRVLFLGFVASALAGAPTAYFFRNMMVKERSQIQLLAISIAGIVGVASASFGLGYWALAFQTLTYTFCNSLFLWFICPWRPGLSFNLRALQAMLPFSLKQLCTGLFTQINNNLFSSLLGRFYTMRDAGVFSQANKWTTMGHSTISGMVNSVGQPVFRQTIDDVQRLRRVFRKMVRFAAFLSFPAMFGLAITAPQLISLAITNKWLECVPVMQILCIGGAFMPLTTLYTNLFNALNRPSISMWNTIGLGATQIASLMASYTFGMFTMLIAYTTINVVWLFVWQFFARRHIGLRFRDLLADIAPYLILGATVALLVQWGFSSIQNNIAALLVKVLAAAATYFAVLWMAGSSVLGESIQFLLKRKIKTDANDSDDENP